MIVWQSIKDVNQSLCDDNLVETDRIGAGCFFWALPSKGYQQRQNLIDNLSNHAEEIKLEISKCQEKFQKEMSMRASDDGSREEMLKEFLQLKKENQDLNKKLSLFEKCDPKKLEEISKKKKISLDSANRWTDNLFEMESWMKKQNAGLSTEDLHQNFPIFKDLDYVA